LTSSIFVLTSKIIVVQWHSDFLNLPGKQKLVRKVGEFEKSGIKLQSSTVETETTFASSYREVRKNEGLRNWDSTDCTLHWCFKIAPVFEFAPVLHENCTHV